MTPEQRMARLATLPARDMLRLLDWVDVQAPAIIDAGFNTILVPEECGRCGHADQPGRHISDLTRTTTAEGAYVYQCTDTAACHARPGHHLCPCCDGQGFMHSGRTCQFCHASGVIEDPPAASAPQPCTECGGAYPGHDLWCTRHTGEHGDPR